MALGFEGCNYARTLSMGRKRVVVTNNLENQVTTPLKRVRSGRFNLNSERSRLEALPLDVLIRVLCCVDHDDLEQLIHVSKTIREATEIAQKFHFEYSTPKKKTFGFRTPFDIEDANDFEEIEAPKAPLRKSKSRLSGKNLGGISVALFGSTE